MGGCPIVGRCVGQGFSVYSALVELILPTHAVR